jgi:hypothetical protein
MKIRYLAIGALLAVSATTVADEQVSVRVTPAFAFAPASVMIRTRIEPHADNRSMEIVADSGGFYRSSTIPLEGDRSPRSATFEFRSLPPGEYDISATIIGSNGRPRVTQHTTVNIMGEPEGR